MMETNQPLCRGVGLSTAADTGNRNLIKYTLNGWHEKRDAERVRSYAEIVLLNKYI